MSDTKKKTGMNLPTKLTVLRIVMIPVFVALFFIKFPYHYFVAVAVFILASFTDFLDGYLARKYNLITDLGKFLDPIADKMLVCCALFSVILLDVSAVFLQEVYVIVTVICSMIIMSRELLVSGFRIIASGKNVVLAADFLGKIKTVLQLVALILLLPVAQIISLNNLIGKIVLFAGLILLALSTVMALISGANYIIKNRAVLAEKTAKKTTEEDVESEEK